MGMGVFDDQICAGMPTEKACIGDSGGPLMSEERKSSGTVQFTIFGVLSRLYFDGCQQNSWPGIYTNVVNHLPWILSQIQH